VSAQSPDQRKWDARYAERGPVARPHASLLDHASQHLPHEGRALDVAGGDGRNALWLAKRGLAVTICDVSPAGLANARALAEARGLALETQALDLTSGDFPEGPFDLILSFHYLQRDLFPCFAEALAPGGVLVFCQPTQRNLERHAHPSARFLLEDGELEGLIPDGLEVVSLEEGWLDEGRHEARLIARRS
jgi:tellurite methyltransferase